MSKIKNVNPLSVYTFDFSTLYTNLPLIDIHNKLAKLIKKVWGIVAGIGPLRKTCSLS